MHLAKHETIKSIHQNAETNHATLRKMSLELSGLFRIFGII